VKRSILIRSKEKAAEFCWEKMTEGFRKGLL
jgi:hypothetical protein